MLPQAAIRKQTHRLCWTPYVLVCACLRLFTALFDEERWLSKTPFLLMYSLWYSRHIYKTTMTECSEVDYFNAYDVIQGRIHTEMLRMSSCGLSSLGHSCCRRDSTLLGRTKKVFGGEYWRLIDHRKILAFTRTQPYTRRKSVKIFSDDWLKETAIMVG